MHLVSQNPADTQAIATRAAQQALTGMPGRAHALVIGLSGDLGAGKTTFTQGFAHALGITQTPKSPTFNLLKQYPIPGTPYALWHMDCYRLEGHRDLATLDLHMLFADPHNIIMVEWPERIGDALPRDHWDIRMAHTGGDTRSITLPSPLT